MIIKSTKIYLGKIIKHFKNMQINKNFSLFHISKIKKFKLKMFYPKIKNKLYFYLDYYLRLSPKWFNSTSLDNPSPIAFPAYSPI